MLKDPKIFVFLKKFPQRDWHEVVKETLKLGIHSMNTIESLNIKNLSPERPLKTQEFEAGLEDDSTVVLAESLLKYEGATPSSKEATKIIRTDSKIPLKKKKALSQVSKKASRITPKTKRAPFELFKEKKDSKRIHSVKHKGKVETLKPENDNSCGETKRKFNFEFKDWNAKSFKSIKKKGIDLQLSPQHLKVSPKYVKASLGVNDFREFYRNNMSCRNQQVDFPLRLKKNVESEHFMYVTSSSDESVANE
jgi:hypothetical protein